MDSKIKNVVFDLGGVLINLDFDNCLNAFRKAGFQDIEKQVCQFKGKGFFSLFELGEISPEEFRSAIRKEASESLTDRKIDDMWNLMLLDQQHRRLFCHKKQGYGDPGHGEDKSYCHPAKQPLYREVLKLHFASPPVH